jgi:hypothetical protein
LVTLRRPPQPSPVAEVPQATPPMAPPDTPALDNLEAARDSVPPAPPQPQEDAKIALQEATALQMRIAELERAAQIQQAAHANMAIEQSQPSEGDRFEAAISELPDGAKAWLRERPQYIMDPNKNADLRFYHETAVRSGLKFDTPDYYQSLERHLGLAGPKQEEAPMSSEPKAPPPPSRVVVSAPVSRDTTGGDYTPSPGKIVLSKAEVEIANSTGVSLQEFARQKQRLAALKRAGHYSEG